MIAPERLPAWSPTDLVNFLICDHLATLEAAAGDGVLERPALGDEQRLLMRIGREHETATLAALRAVGAEIEEITYPVGAAAYERAAADTIAAFERGAAYVHNAAFTADGFIGVADLAIRVPGRSRFGAWSYEVADIKLARTAKPTALVQLCAYSEALERITGTPPLRMHLILGDGSRETFAVREFDAYYRELKRRFAGALARDADTYPEKSPACATCRWSSPCADVRRADDDLSLVAGMRPDQIERLRECGISTVAALAAQPLDARPASIAAFTWRQLHRQATLQIAMRADGVPRYELLPLVDNTGFALLPPASPEDLFFDMEGDPHYPGGLEYLFGFSYVDDAGNDRFDQRWAHDHADERVALASFMDVIRERRARDAAMHVFHYATYEITAISRLANGTALEAELARWIDDGVFVDLYAIVKGALALSTESYSIKSVEKFYRAGARSADVKTAMGSVVAYERYRITRDPAILEEIRVYNQDDCDSTLALFRWLFDRKREAEAGGTYAMAEEPPELDPERVAREAELEALCERLRVGHADGALLGALLDYHRREDRPAWREFFQRRRTPEAELIDDGECLVGLEPCAEFAPYRLDKSLAHTFRFPLQRLVLHAGSTVADHATGASAGEIVSIAIAGGEGRLVLKRSSKLAKTALPTTLIRHERYPSGVQRDALRRLAAEYETRGRLDGLADALLSHARPAFIRPHMPIDNGATTPERLATLIADLDRSVLVVQGPPGSGKTWTAARAIVQLLERGLRIGVCSKTHKAINNLLTEIECVAAERDVKVRGVKKATTSNDDSYLRSPSGAITDDADAKNFPPGPEVRLIGGTEHLFARPEMTGSVDVLVIDEAGQVALADALAVTAASSSMVLLGDPQQLPHVTAGAHPPGADASVLEHMLDGATTIAAHDGIFLGTSYRMHPEICQFVSELMYDARLRSDARCARQRLVAVAGVAGAGLRARAVQHVDCAAESPAEADAIARDIAALAGARLVDRDGNERALDLERDVLVVAPYNAQVRLLETVIAERVGVPIRVGTVDRFQGQEAPVVFFSMTTSTAADAPRNIAFLFDRNRLNVAISRAQALAIVVYSPALLAMRATTVEQMQLVNGLARFVELATPLPSIATLSA